MIRREGQCWTRSSWDGYVTYLVVESLPDGHVWTVHHVLPLAWLDNHGSKTVGNLLEFFEDREEPWESYERYERVG